MSSMINPHHTTEQLETQELTDMSIVAENFWLRLIQARMKRLEWQTQLEIAFSNCYVY